MDLLGGYGSSDEDEAPVVAPSPTTIVASTSISSLPSAASIALPLPNKQNVAAPPPHTSASASCTESAAPRPSPPLSQPVSHSASQSAHVSQSAPAAGPVLPPSASIPAPLAATATASAPKRKLPSAADLLAKLPVEHTYAGFGKSNASVSTAAPVAIDAVGTKYNAVALPTAFKAQENEDDVVTWRRPPPRTSETISFAARSAAAAGNVGGAQASSSSSSATTAAAAAATTTTTVTRLVSNAATAFAPPQLRGRPGGNVVTEDTSAWNTQRKKPKSASSPEAE